MTRFPRPASPLQDVATIIGSREMLSALLLLYDHQLEHEGTTGWESLLWVVNQLWEMQQACTVTHTTEHFTWYQDCMNGQSHMRWLSVCFVPSLPQLIEIVGRINVTSSTCVHEFSRFFWRFCRTFGKIFTNTKVKTTWLIKIKLSSESTINCFFNWCF